MSEELILDEISAETLNGNFTKTAAAVNAKAELNGDSTQKFKVADAVLSTEAINKGQLETSLTALNLEISDLETSVEGKANSADVVTALAGKLDSSDTTVTKQGNTFNGVNQLVKLDSNGKLPAVDGSLLTNVSGSAFYISALGTVTSNFTLEENKVTTANITSTCTMSLPTISNSTKEVMCILDFTTSSSSYPTLPTGILKKDGKSITYSTSSEVRNRLIFTTVNGGTSWEVEYKVFGGVETTFIQPTLSADGTLGGSNFAVYSVNIQSGYPAYQAFDNNSSTILAAYVPDSLIMYNPNALKVSSISITNWNGYNITGYSIYGSNDNSNWTILTSGTNSNTIDNSTWTIEIPTANRDFYNYYKLYTSAGTNTTYNIRQLNLTATYIATT